MDALIVLTSCPCEVATDIARDLVQKKLAACVNILPTIQSIYRWHDAVEETKESLLVIKTTQERYSALEQEICKLSPYEVPEVISFPIAQGANAYLEWILKSCNGH